MSVLLQNNVWGRVSSVREIDMKHQMKKKKVLYIDANNLYGYSMSQKLLYDESKFDRNVQLEDLINTPDDSDIGCFLEFDLNNPDDIKEKTKFLNFVLWKEKLFPTFLLFIWVKTNQILIQKLRN